MRIRHFTYMMGCMALLTLPALAHQRSWPGKRLAESLPGTNKFTLKQVSLAGEQIAWVEKNLGEAVGTADKIPSFYKAEGKGGSDLGVVQFLDVNGANGNIEMSLVIDPSGKVIRVLMFEYSDGKELASAKFLDQFAGKKGGDKFQVGGDVIAPQGREKVAQRIATAVRKGLLLAMAGLRLGVKT